MKKIILILILILSSCSVITNKKIENKLDKSLLIYAKAMRWGAYEQLYSFHKKQPKLPSPEVLKALQKVKVTKYITGQRFPTAKNELYQRITINYYIMPGVSQKSLSVKQIWRYDKENDRWYINHKFPEFK